MWYFWVAAGLLASLTAALVAVRAAAASKRAATLQEDPSLAVYRRQLVELDDLAARGLLGEDERRAAFAEAGRRLLAAADQPDPAPRQEPDRATRMLVLLGAAAAGLAALLLYLALGSPGRPDEPYRARLAGWRAADPRTLDASQMAAVLRTLAADRPSDPQVHEFLGRAELAAGDALAAARAFQTAARLAPRRADLMALVGASLVSAADGKLSPDAQAAFDRALSIDPHDVGARYFLARAQIASGEVEKGLAGWKALVAELPPNDPRRPALEADIARESGAAAAPAGPAQAGAMAVPSDPAAQQAFIRSMVANLVARLKAQPNDPEGWARLLRSYRVLGDAAAGRQALEEARRVFASRPDVMARIQAEAAAAPSR